MRALEAKRKNMQISLNKSLLLLLVFLSGNSTAQNNDRPSFVDAYISNELQGYHIPKGKLNKPIRTELLKKGKNTKPWSISGNFNGDNKVDWAGLLVNKKGLLDVVVIYSVKKHHTHKVIFSTNDKDTKNINIGIYPEQPGTIHGFPFDDIPEKDLIVKLQNIGIHIYFFETSSVLYYFKKNRIYELWTSD